MDMVDIPSGNDVYSLLLKMTYLEWVVPLKMVMFSYLCKRLPEGGISEETFFNEATTALTNFVAGFCEDHADQKRWLNLAIV